MPWHVVDDSSTEPQLRICDAFTSITEFPIRLLACRMMHAGSRLLSRLTCVHGTSACPHTRAHMRVPLLSSVSCAFTRSLGCRAHRCPQSGPESQWLRQFPNPRGQAPSLLCFPSALSLLKPHCWKRSRVTTHGTNCRAEQQCLLQRRTPPSYQVPTHSPFKGGASGSRELQQATDRPHRLAGSARAALEQVCGVLGGMGPPDAVHPAAHRRDCAAAAG